MDNLLVNLEKYFGYSSFKEGQREVVEALLHRSDTLLLLPTGGGKSLSFQLPTLMMDGVSIVISPLIALMQDQVAALNAQKLSAAMLSHIQSSEENSNIIKALLLGELKFLYISPERLNTPQMQSILSQIEINFFVIDEAHCISEWGHEFREDYRSLTMLKKLYPQVPIAAFTATATKNVQEDILKLLSLQNPFVYKGKIFRKNLNIQIKQRVKKGYDSLLRFLETHENENGIIYVSSRKKSEEISEYLNKNGFNTLYYHAGMSKENRDEAFQDFVYDRVQIVVATIAFGMGIDKSNIRFVVHMSMPKSIENYYQEIGRAGRDSDDADVLMLYGAEDVVLARARLQEIDNEAYKRHLEEKLNVMYRFVSTERCRHQYIAAYFEDEISECMQSCDNCLRGEVEKTDITQLAQKLLSTVYRTAQKFGKSYLVDVLRGSNAQKILDNRHDELSVYGIGADIHRNIWFVVVDRLLELESLKIGEYQVLHLTHEGIRVLKGEEKVFIASYRLEVKEKKAKKRVLDISGDFDFNLFEKLRYLRASLAQELQVPAYIVFSDKTLKSLAKHKPTDKASMLEVNGVGEKKYEQFGEAFLKEIEQFI